MSDHVTLLRDTAARLGVSDIASHVLDDPRFAMWSASAHPYQHHYGDGGLARHTHEVVHLCLVNRATLAVIQPHEMPSERKVYLAALAHDYGKIWDYESAQHIVDNLPFAPPSMTTVWRGTEAKRTIHHISRSAIEWSRAVDKYPAYRDIESDVLHAILSHHGQRAWGSPVSPKTRLAWLLHICDMMSARVNDADTMDVVKHYGV